MTATLGFLLLPLQGFANWRGLSQGLRILRFRVRWVQCRPGRRPWKLLLDSPILMWALEDPQHTQWSWVGSLR